MPPLPDACLSPPLCCSSSSSSFGATTWRRHPVSGCLALCLGYFFLLRASEFLPVMHLPGSRHLKGGHLVLRKEGKPCNVNSLSQADEVVIHLRGIKTDRYNRGATRNHFCGDPPLCPVDATIRMFTAYPERYFGMEESHLPRLRNVTIGRICR